MRRICLVLGLSLMATLLVAAPASADLDAVIADLRKDGAIDPCAHTSKDLRAALDEIGPDVDQYAPELPSAIRDALSARAAGACEKGGGGSGGGDRGGGAGGGAASAGSAGGGAPAGGGGGPAGAGAPAIGATPSPGGPTPTPQTPLTAAPAVVQEAVPPSAPAAVAQTSGEGAPVALLAVLGGLLALGVVSFLAARWWAWEPRWLLGTRHACTEAGYRASATWAEFTDWVRLGR